MAMSSSCSSRISITLLVEGLYKKHGPLALIGSRTKLMPNWADRIDHLDPKKIMPIKGGAQARAPIARLVSSETQPNDRGPSIKMQAIPKRSRQWVVAGLCQTKIFYLFGSTEPPAAESR
jgi:hypothetical protein